MADPKKGLGDDGDDWASAIDEWDQALDFLSEADKPKPDLPKAAAPAPAATAPTATAPAPAAPAPTAAAPAPAPTVAAPAPAPTVAAPAPAPAAAAPAPLEDEAAPSEDEAAPLEDEAPALDKTPVPAGEAAAPIEAAAAPLDTEPELPEPPLGLDALPEAGFPVESDEPPPLADLEGAASDDEVSIDEEPAPLDAAPLLELPPGAQPTEDPLMHLFDGEMELPEEAGEALGSLLGEQVVPEPPPPIEPGPSELEIEASFAEPSRGSTSASTRVAGTDELSALLEGIDELEPTGKAHVDPIGLTPPPPAPPQAAPAPIPAPGSAATLARIPSTRLPTVTAAPSAPPEPEPSDPSLPSVMLGDDFGGGESTRVASSDDLQALLDIPIPDDLPPARAEAAGGAPAPVEVAPALHPAGGSGAGSVVLDDEFYDDISIEAGREEPSQKAPAPTPPRKDESAPDEPVGEVASEPILVDPPLRVPADRLSDPDRTPLPVPDGEDDEELFGEAQPRLPLPSLESRPVAVHRLSGTFEAPRLSLPDLGEAPRLEPAYLRDQLALLDTERLLRQEEPARAARLACAAARLCEKLGDPDGAEERYQAALELDPGSQSALRGLRRVRLAEGKADQVVGMIDREIEAGSAGEKRALQALKAELHLARGDLDLARESFRDLLEARPDDLGAALGLCDIAAAEAGPGSTGELSEALARLAEALESAPASDGRPALRAAVAIERGRLDEAEGRVREAVARFREALGYDPQAMGALFGLLRVAVRTPAEADDVEVHARLAEVLPRGPLRGAIERRLGLFKLRAGDPAGARPPLSAAAGADGDRGDPLALRALADLEQKEGRVDEAVAALSRLVEQVGDPGRRADVLYTIGELHEQKGNTGAAVAAYARAASEFPEDPRAARALERAQSQGGDKEAALDRHLKRAERDPQRAPLERVRAARLLEELGRRDEALALAGRALAERPGFAPAVELTVELELAAGRTDQAARTLAAAAEAPAVKDEPAAAAALRERAARLWHKAGRRDEALSALRPLLQHDDRPDEVFPLRWLEQRLCAATIDAQLLADSLRAEADAIEAVDPARAAALWHRRGLVLAIFDPEGALESARTALRLDPAHGPAATEIAAAVLRVDSPLPGKEELPHVWRARVEAAGARPESLALRYRLALSFAEDAGELSAALETAEALRRDPAVRADDPAVPELAFRLAQRAGDDGAVLEALERELAATPEDAPPEQRFALLIAIGERLEQKGSPERAAERYRQALAVQPGGTVALFALERALRASRNFAQLADLALEDLKQAGDTAHKVAAYERLAFIDGDLRGEPESALGAMQSIIEIDPAHHGAVRLLERRALREQRWPELVELYGQLGLGAREPRFAAAVHLDRARLRVLSQRAAAGPEAGGQALPPEALQAAVDNDHRLALFKDPTSRPALHQVLSRARHAGDLEREAELSTRLGEVYAEDARTAAVCFTRAAEALADQGKPEEAKARFGKALERSGLHLPALTGLASLSLLAGDLRGAAEAAEKEGEALRDPAARSSAWLLAGAIAEEKLEELPRALADLRQAIAPAADPRNREAFERLRRVLTTTGDWPALAEAYQKRLEVETDGRRLTALHLELAKVARDRLDDRARARSELKAVLSQDAAHPEALAMLAELYWQDQQWTEAAETLIKRARVEKDRLALKNIFFQLGIIYSEKLPDPKRAIASFGRVVKADPSDIVALEHLSNLYLKEWDWKGALEATRRLAEVEPDRGKKIAHLHRVAKIYEEGWKDARNALGALRSALDLDPMNLPSIGELARFFDRQSDVQSMRVHLDRTAARVRALLDKDPWDPTAFRALVKIFGWRRAPDRAAMAAGVLEHLGQAEAEEKAVLAKLQGREPYPGSALADAALDESLFDARVPAGFRHLFRLLDEPLGKLFRADLKRLGVGRAEKLNRGHAVRELATRIGNDLGLREFDVYVTAQHPQSLIVELTDPLSLVIGSRLVEGAHEHEVRFYLGRALKMVQCHMALPMRLSADELGVLVGAIVRQFVPDFVPVGFEERTVAAEGARLSKLIPKKMQGELFPFAMECASTQLDLRQITPALIDAANRAGLLACGLIPSALTALKRLGDEQQVRALVRFAMSEEMAELRRLAGTSIG